MQLGILPYFLNIAYFSPLFVKKSFSGKKLTSKFYANPTTSSTILLHSAKCFLQQNYEIVTVYILGQKALSSYFRVVNLFPFWIV